MDTHASHLNAANRSRSSQTPSPSASASASATSFSADTRDGALTSNDDLESISVRGGDSDSDPDESEDAVVDDEDDFAPDQDNDSSIRTFTVARLESSSGAGDSGRNIKLKTGSSTVKLESSDGGKDGGCAGPGSGGPGTGPGNSSSGLLAKDDSVKISTENLQTSGAYSAREESLKREGFTKEIYLERERWHGYIKDYDGGILMECKIDPKLPYTDLSSMIRRQRQAVDERIRELSNCQIVYPGFDFQKKEARIPRKIIKVDDIPGLREAGWTPDQWGHTRFKMFSASPDNATNQKQLTSFMRSLLKSMHDHVDAWPFKEPVDGRDVPDYYEFIKDPLELKTMSKRVESEQYYVTFEMFVVDMRRMFNNARTYNSPDTIYYKCATRLEAHFQITVRSAVWCQNSVKHSCCQAWHTPAVFMEIVVIKGGVNALEMNTEYMFHEKYEPLELKTKGISATSSKLFR